MRVIRIRKKRILIYSFAILALIAFACLHERMKKDENTSNTLAQKTFVYPEIPDGLTGSEERKSYFLKHYWDEFDFGDTVLLYNRSITEQAFADYLLLLKQNREDKNLLSACVANLCARVEGQEHARKVFMNWMDDYLYNPNSPYYDELLYAVYLQYMLRNAELDETLKSSFNFKLQLISRNSPGEQATSFDYYLPDGKKCTLSQTPVNSNRLLMIFYDPECFSCHEILSNMINDPALQEAVAHKRLTVLAVYTENNEQIWRESLSSMPEGWIIGTDRQAILNNSFYDLKALPSLYLLDEHKKVILKDTPYETIRMRLKLH